MESTESLTNPTEFNDVDGVHGRPTTLYIVTENKKFVFSTPKVRTDYLH